MGDSKDLRQNVSANLRSVTQSCKGGVPIETLERDYRDLVGDQIPFRALGYSSLEAMIRSMPDVVMLQRNASGRSVVMAVADETTAHIASLIARQKSASKKPARTRRPTRVRRVPAAAARTSSTRQFNKGTRAPPPYMEKNIQAHQRPTSTNGQLSEVVKVTRSVPGTANIDEKISTSKPKVIPTSYGSKYEVPPRFLRKQERPLSSLENNSTEDQLSSFSSKSSNIRQRLGPESSMSCSNEESYFVPPPLYRQHRTFETEPRSAREFVENYAQKNNLKHRYHTILMGQRRKSYVSSLTIGEKKYSSYPDNDNAQTVEAAEEAAAENARKDIVKAEGFQKELPVTSISDEAGLELLYSRIDQMVAEKPKGLWNTVIPSEYEEKYKERLPEQWFPLVQRSCSFYYERVDENRIILYPSSESGRASPTSSCSTQDEEDIERKLDRLDIKIPALTLPTQECFDVFVTNIHDAQCVSVRFFEHADKFQDLSDEMNSFYAENKLPVTNVILDKPYAIFIYNLWHRAIADEVDPTGEKVRCELMDEGDMVEVEISNMQELDSRFLNLAFQAYSFKLAELDSCSIFIKIATLKLYLLGKPLVAKLVDNERIILYDTSTDEDIDVNHMIFKKTVAESLNYLLPEPGCTSLAYLSHISPCGTTYLSFNSQFTPNLLMEELLRITPLCEEYAKQGCDILKDTVYCAKYIDGIWYRAVIIGGPVENNVEVLYVDYGNTSWVPLSSICELEPISKYLAEMPFQVTRCKLSELPPKYKYWSERATQRLGELTTCDKKLIVRVQKYGTEEVLPEVSLLIRNEQSEIVSINQTLAYDLELFNKQPSEECDRIPAWTKHLFSELGKKEYAGRISSPSRVHTSSPAPLPAENASNEHNEHEGLSNFIPDVAVSAEQQLAKRHGNWVITCPPVGNECDNEVEQFPPLYPVDIPDAGEFFDVFVTMAASPFNFMCQPLKSSKDLDQLFSDMQSFYSNEENLCEMHSVLVKKGEFFAGKHLDGSWYRVRKQSIVTEDPLQVSVYYVDYGDMCILPLPNLQPLFKQFKSLPCQCIKASLKGVKPNGHDWDPMECFEFKKMVEEKQFVSIVENKQMKVEDHMLVYSLELVLTDVSDPDIDVYISEELIKKDLAQPAK